MAKKKSTLLKSLESQGRRVLAIIQQEIRDLEGQLDDLREQATRWASALEKRTRPSTTRSSAKKTASRKKKTAAKKPSRPTSGKRTNWDDVVNGLPKTFTIDDVMKRPGVKARGRAQVYPALTRWTDAKKIKRVGKGKYQKL